MSTRDQKLLAAALKKLERDNLSKVFDPRVPDSRPTKIQTEILKDIGKIRQRFVVAGNQCLAEGTLVLTSTGPKKIEEIEVGETVYDHLGKPIKVLKTFKNGKKEVHTLTRYSQVLVKCTADHTFLTTSPRYKEGVAILNNKERKVREFINCTQIRRVEINAPLGSVDCPEAYMLGVLSGDGCSRDTGIVLSSSSSLIPDKIQKYLGGVVTDKKANYCWRIKGATLSPDSLYYSWIKGRYAHEKIADIEVLKTWNRKSLLSYVAGLIDTDGSVFTSGKGNVTIALEMQAESIMKATQWAFLALWQVQLALIVNDREKYVNGPTYTLKCANNSYSIRMIKELSPHIVTPSKQYKEIYKHKKGKVTDSSRVGAVVSKSTELVETYDLHVSGPRNLYCLANGLVTHNSGKTALAAREIAWILNGDHPWWKRPEDWGDGPLLIMVAGQDRKNLELSIWEDKLSPFLDPSEWKHVRTGGILQYVTSRRTGDKILFVSHGDSSDHNRRHMQGYVANYVWLDEMPGNITILEELQRRINAKNGYLIATFTPKFRNDSIRNIIEAGSPPISKKYTMSMLDNPIYKLRIQEEMSRLDGYAESYKRAILYGEWYTGDSAVYEWDPEKMCAPLPQYYSASWRHCESVDPALKSKFGYTLWAEDPSNGVWYLVNDEYITGIYNPEDMVNEVLSRGKGYNIIRRVTDYAPWYTGIASPKGVHYISPHNKNQRKEELIKGLQYALSAGKIKIPPHNTHFLEEIQSCQWSETTDRIVNSSSYHVMDCCQYFVDCKPPYDEKQRIMPWYEELRRGNHKRKEQEALARKSVVSKGGRISRPIGSWGARKKGGRFG